MQVYINRSTKQGWGGDIPDMVNSTHSSVLCEPFSWNHVNFCIGCPVMNYVTMLVISDLSIFAYLSYHILC